MSEGALLRVAVPTPSHAGLDTLLTYRGERPLAPGTLVRVPLGSRVVCGVVWAGGAGTVDAASVRAVDAVLDAVEPLPDAWRALVDFAAAYYQRGTGELTAMALPAALRGVGAEALRRRVAKLGGARPGGERPIAAAATPALSTAQAAAATAIELAFDAPADRRPILLHGVTGSGKTEVYLHAAARALARGRQALVLVPEIALTPQLEARFAERFPAATLASLHSGLTPAQRLAHWLLAHTGRADLVLGTRLAIFASLPRLGVVVVDEEHDPSFKQQEGARYSARDLAVWRARHEAVPVLLGSATPSLETWQRAEAGHYARLALPTRIGEAAWPTVRLIDLNRGGPGAARERGPRIAPELVEALQRRRGAGEQSLVFLNRRGYAPVLHCGDCGWLSDCPHCSAWRVFHRQDRTLRCHHCGFAEAVPRACPSCGNPDIAPLGRGTERLEEQLGALLPGARIARIDADAARTGRALEERLAAVHAGDVDILVGTQMIAKGHDFRRIGLVAAVDADASLFSSDFRAPERLFALLLQAAGRAGRDAALKTPAEMLVQTWHPAHPLYAALQRHDFAAFAAAQLAERQAAGLPPFAHLALLRAEATTAAAAGAFLAAAGDAARGLGEAASVAIYAPVPLTVARVADVERMQLLVESAARPALQAMLRAWQPALHALARERRRDTAGRLLRWAVDVDPLTI